MKRCLAAAFAAVLLLSPVPAAAAPLQLAQCTPTSGVILAVDFGHWGGPLLRSCGSTPTTGYELLHQGGWSTAGTQHDGPAFVCRIGYSGFRGGTKYPTADEDKCILTPPATAYWSYWHADPGATTWTYSQLGAMSYRPKPGSVDLWIFGATGEGGSSGRPSVSPDSLRAKAPRPSPPRPKPPSSTAPRTSTQPAPPAPSPSAAVSPADSGSPSASVTAVDDPVAAQPSIVDAEPTLSSSTSDAGSPVPLLVTLGVLGALAAFAGFALRRRRSSGSDA